MNVFLYKTPDLNTQGLFTAWSLSSHTPLVSLIETTSGHGLIIRRFGVQVPVGPQMKIHLLVGFSFVEGALDRNPEQGFIRRHLPVVDDGGRWSEANTNSLWDSWIETLDGGSPRSDLLRKGSEVEARAKLAANSLRAHHLKVSFAALFLLFL